MHAFTKRNFIKVYFLYKGLKIRAVKLKTQIDLAIKIYKTSFHIALFNLAFKNVLTQAFYKKQFFLNKKLSIKLFKVSYNSLI